MRQRADWTALTLGRRLFPNAPLHPNFCFAFSPFSSLLLLLFFSHQEIFHHRLDLTLKAR